MWIASPDVGLRVGYFPRRFLGLEAEGGVMPSGLRDREGSALLYTARGQLVGRLALWRVFPFVLVGGGVLGLHSKPAVLGSDVDAALHVGAGAEVFVDRRNRFKVRFDARDLISWRRGTEASFGAHSLELTLGFTVCFP
jgi:OOP family OmpA-OmpF porin